MKNAPTGYHDTILVLSYFLFLVCAQHSDDFLFRCKHLENYLGSMVASGIAEDLPLTEWRSCEILVEKRRLVNRTHRDL